METIDAIFQRRSIRKYRREQIDKKIIDLILRAGMYAPSARNTQPWHFIVTDQRPQLDQLADIHPYGKMLKTATAAILVCGDTDIEKSLIYLVQDCSAATQNMLLAAHNVGLGSVWLGIQPRKKRIDAMRNFFNLPESIVPISLIALGIPDEKKRFPERFDSGRIHYNGWNSSINT